MTFAAMMVSVGSARADGGIAVPPSAQAETERECSACHVYLRPLTHKVIEWRRIMTDLSNHMGEDASLPENLRADIEAYLEANASDAVGARHSE